MEEFSYFHNTILLASLYWNKFIIEVRVFCFSTKTYRWRKLKITSGGDFSQPSSKHHSFAEVFLVSLIINLLMWGEKQDFEINKSTKKKFAQGKFKWKKIHARQLTLQNIHATVWKIHTRNLLTKKNSCDSKIPHPSPTTFLMVRPWIGKTVNTSIVLQEKSQSGVNQFVALWPVFCCDGGGCAYICTCIRRQVECTLYWG